MVGRLGSIRLKDERGQEGDKKKFRVRLVSLTLTMRVKIARGSLLRKIRENTNTSLPQRVVPALRFVLTAIVKLDWVGLGLAATKTSNRSNRITGRGV